MSNNSPKFLPRICFTSAAQRMILRGTRRFPAYNLKYKYEKYNDIEYLSLLEHNHLTQQLETKVVNLETKLLNLEAENARLREFATELIDEIDGSHDLGGPSFDGTDPLREALRKSGERKTE